MRPISPVEFQLIVRVEGSPLCAVSLLTDHFARIPGNSDDLLFLRQVTPRLYRPIRYSEVLFFLKDLAQRLGLDRDYRCRPPQYEA